MMRRFRDAPIKQKLVIVTALVTTTALLVAGVAIFISDSLLFRNRLQTDLAALAQITADNSTAALAFEDQGAATETLTALKARSHLISACIYRANGSMLARYVRSGSALGCPAADASGQPTLLSANLVVSRPVLLQQRRIGTVVLLYDSNEVLERMRRYGTIIVLVLLVSSLFSFLISSNLHNLIARPIQELAQASSAVSKTRDYSIRAQRLSEDELGTLVDTFNEMLSDIQSRDVELRKALAELQESNENLGRSNADLERFAFVASHDLQEPLRMMSVFSQLLSRRYGDKLDAEAGEFIEHIVTGATRMRELLSDLLEYTHLSSIGNAPEDMVDLNAVLEKAEKNLAIPIGRSSAEISADRLPCVAGYEAHFVPLFQNLLGNALKYRSGEAPRICVRVQDAGGHYRFEFGDNGIGIAAEFHEQIFIAFKRLHGREIPGTGIGLAICHRIVDRYGGKLWVESQLGKGSRFIFTLPKAAVNAESKNGQGP